MSTSNITSAVLQVALKADISQFQTDIANAKKMLSELFSRKNSDTVAKVTPKLDEGAASNVKKAIKVLALPPPVRLQLDAVGFLGSLERAKRQVKDLADKPGPPIPLRADYHEIMRAVEKARGNIKAFTDVQNAARPVPIKADASPVIKEAEKAKKAIKDIRADHSTNFVKIRVDAGDFYKKIKSINDALRNLMPRHRPPGGQVCLSCEA